MHPTRLPSIPGFFLFLVIALPGLLLTAGPAPAACRPPNPEGVLGCLAAAYADKDTVALGELYADDYAYSSSIDSTSWGRKEELKSAAAMIRGTKRIKMSFPEGFRIKPGESEGTYTVYEIQPELTIDAMVDGQLKHFVTAGEQVTVGVRRVAGSDPHWVIYKWAVVPAPAKH